MPLLQTGKREKNALGTKDRIYLSISSEGYGHSSRALAIASQFDVDEILVGTYDYAFERVKNHGYSCVHVPQEVKFVGSEGSFDVGQTILQNPARALGFNQIVQDEMDLIKRYNISLVVADGRMAPVLAASRLDVPCVVVTNQSAFYPFFAQDSPLVKLFGRSFEWVMKFWLSSAEEILIPDFPPPDTVCLPNLSDNFQVKKRTRFVGPLVSWQADDVEAIPKDTSAKARIVVSLGGHAYRRPLFDAVLKVAKYYPEIRFDLLTTFKTTQAPANVTIHGTVKNAAPYFKGADLVITQAGHSSAMELLTLGKPSIVVPDAKQIEQENNAERLAVLGVSKVVEHGQLEQGIKGEALGNAIDEILSTPSYQENADRLAGMARDIHGAKQAANVLREYAHRLLAY
jgi:UDP-N-acetylglucosamine--N-acetylmuramyl-(pentapeptide) pyrophosphoryl-undecaprenol N-acetylglucosamine transferase